MGGLGPLGTVIGGSLGSGLGTLISGGLDNFWGSRDVQKSTVELFKNAVQSSAVALATSAVTGCIDFASKSVDYVLANELLPCLTDTFGKMITAFFGAVDDAATYILIMGDE
jgi:hypothetical protein